MAVYEASRQFPEFSRQQNEGSGLAHEGTHFEKTLVVLEHTLGRSVRPLLVVPVSYELPFKQASIILYLRLLPNWGCPVIR